MKNSITKTWGLNSMYVEILIIGVLIFTILTVNGYVKPNKFIYDNQDLFMKLKEIQNNKLKC